MSNDHWIVGLDFAVDPKNVGVALGNLTQQGLDLLETRICSRQDPPGRVAAEFVEGRSSVLFALDAPLGWPHHMAHALATHSAGDYIGVKPNKLFRRVTDRAVKREIGVQPLDVGADRIARTALAALTHLRHDRAVTR